MVLGVWEIYVHLLREVLVAVFLSHSPLFKRWPYVSCKCFFFFYYYYYYYSEDFSWILFKSCFSGFATQTEWWWSLDCNHVVLKRCALGGTCRKGRGLSLSWQDFVAVVIIDTLQSLRAWNLLAYDLSFAGLVEHLFFFPLLFRNFALLVFVTSP
jgi:hypothetical protein